MYQDAHAIAGVDRLSLYGKADVNLGPVQWTTEGLFTRREYDETGWRQFFPIIGGAAFYDSNPSGWQSPFGNTSAVQSISMLPTDTEVNIDYYFVTTGLTGDFGALPFLSNFTWDLKASYSSSEGEYSSDQILKDTAGDASVLTTDGFYRAPQYNPFDPNFLAGRPSRRCV